MPECQGSIGLISKISPLTSSTRQSRWKILALPIRWYCSTVNRYRLTVPIIPDLPLVRIARPLGRPVNAANSIHHASRWLAGAEGGEDLLGVGVERVPVVGAFA